MKHLEDSWLPANGVTKTKPTINPSSICCRNVHKRRSRGFNSGAFHPQFRPIGPPVCLFRACRPRAFAKSAVLKQNEPAKRGRPLTGIRFQSGLNQIRPAMGSEAARPLNTRLEPRPREARKCSNLSRLTIDGYDPRLAGALRDMRAHRQPCARRRGSRPPMLLRDLRFPDFLHFAEHHGIRQRLQLLSQSLSAYLSNVLAGRAPDIDGLSFGLHAWN